MRIRSQLLGLLLLLPAVVSAQETRYLVTGPDLAGTVTVHENSSPSEPLTQVTVELSFTRFGAEQGKQTTITGNGLILPSGVLELNYDHDVVIPRRGVASWLRNPNGGNGAGIRAERIRVQMQPQPDGYRGTIAGAEQVWRRAPETNGLVVLMIPGLSTNYWNRFNLPYFNENRDALRAMGIEAYRIGTHADDSIDTSHAFSTENSVEQNAQVIAQEIRTQAAFGKKVVIFAHSKGGTDATAAIALNPDLVPHVAGMIAIQPVYAGSPVADLAGGYWITSVGVKLAFEVWSGGSRDAVMDLRHKSRAAFVAQHPYPSDKIPTVVIRSSFDRSKVRIGRTASGERLTNTGKRLFQRVLRMNQALIERTKGQASDGMVSLADQVIPGATLIDKDDLDHFEPGLTMISRHTPADLTTESMGVLLGKLAR